ncbi:ZIP family metal transporter [Pollutimonas nitritireducens]|uniref:ZIP family metal transporter n=1 Tax=Pollutimonas nitritireducens TaxID=2045209 RepID=A0A2N4UGU4_9BURK|nr:ZIP family metal transporter [Pollutimonas nitritireducens]PLC54241.1 ZIP family metal transporter [Pollutimonas nitritireducens]
MEELVSKVAASDRPNGKQISKLRYWLVLSILAIATILLCVALYTTLIDPNQKMVGALWGGSMAALATALGTLPILFSLNFSQRSYDSMLGFGAGVMLAACSFSLIIPALDAAESQGLGPWSGSGVVAGGLLIGALVLLLIDRVMPHEHFVKGLEGGHARKLKRVWLFVLAISLHNLPEGLAIGVGFTGPDALAAQALAMGIAIQDVPEGMVVALALRGVGYGRGLSAGVAVLSGLVEPLAAVFGVAIIGISAALLPWGMAAAAGAMLFVISHEIIPESHRQGHESSATIGLIIGFGLMMVLDTALG